MLPSAGAGVQRLPVSLMVSTSAESPFRQRFCHAQDCGALFFICPHCDRGQRYCSLACRLRSRLAQLRAARRRHQQSPEGRLDHRDRQRAFRKRKAEPPSASAEKSVMDQGSKAALTFATIEPLLVSAPSTPLRQRLLSDLGWVVCHFCGRVGRFLNPFHESG